jgi:hypothetical protein
MHTHNTTSGNRFPCLDINKSYTGCVGSACQAAGCVFGKKPAGRVIDRAPGVDCLYCGMRLMNPTGRQLYCGGRQKRSKTSCAQKASLQRRRARRMGGR